MNAYDLNVEMVKLLNRHEPLSTQTEAQIEQDILDLFRRTLGFTKTNSRRQVTIKVSKQYRKNIVLSPKRDTEIIIEVKRPEIFSQKRELERAIVQVSGYMMNTSHECPFGIVTDGIRWKVFVLVPFGNFHRAHIILDFSLKDNFELSKMILGRFSKLTIYNFLNFMSGIHVDMMASDFETIMDLDIDRRIRVLRGKVKSLKYYKPDVKILTALYSGGYGPVSFIQELSLESPIRVTSKKKLAARRG